MVILAIDYGESRTGVAACDSLEMLASPVEVISQRYEPKILERLEQLITEKKAELVVVGYPKNMNASIGEKALKCSALAEKLSELTGVKTELWDERLTTVSAHRALNDVNVRGKKRKEVVDSVAAVMILQSYLDYRKQRKQ